MEYSKNDNIKKERHRLISPRDDPELNPCLEESIQSMECLKKNADNRDACELYFLNYKNCQKFWHRVIIERRKQGIEPELPPMDERLRVLKETNHK